jgi:16S rRNA (guanine966-N2)-methyltransferase
MAKRSKKPNVTAGGRMSGGVVRPAAGLRIIGGQFRGRRLHYSGDPRTRPMKDRLREAIFNLIGPAIRGKHALDLFAGTGALALEAISRGANHATLIEQHHPTANIIRQNAVVLGVAELARVVVGNTFIWWQRLKKGQGDGLELAATSAWVVFCSPPYDFYVDRADDMLDLIDGLMQAAPAESIFVVEADDRFDFGRLADPQAWNVRRYLPAVVGIFRKGLGIGD